MADVFIFTVSGILAPTSSIDLQNTVSAVGLQNSPEPMRVCFEYTQVGAKDFRDFLIRLTCYCLQLPM